MSYRAVPIFQTFPPNGGSGGEANTFPMLVVPTGYTPGWSFSHSLPDTSSVVSISSLSVCSLLEGSINVLTCEG